MAVLPSRGFEGAKDGEAKSDTPICWSKVLEAESGDHGFLAKYLQQAPVPRDAQGLTLADWCVWHARNDRRCYETALAIIHGGLLPRLPDDDGPGEHPEPLHLAALAGDVHMVRELLDAGQSPRRCTTAYTGTHHHPLGGHPLAIAAGRGHTGVVDELLHRDPTLVELRDMQGHTAASVALWHGDVGMFRLLRELPPTSGDLTPVGIAAQVGIDPTEVLPSAPTVDGNIEAGPVTDADLVATFSAVDRPHGVLVALLEARYAKVVWGDLVWLALHGALIGVEVALSEDGYPRNPDDVLPYVCYAVMGLMAALLILDGITSAMARTVPYTLWDITLIAAFALLIAHDLVDRDAPTAPPEGNVTATLAPPLSTPDHLFSLSVTLALWSFPGSVANFHPWGGVVVASAAHAVTTAVIPVAILAALLFVGATYGEKGWQALSTPSLLDIFAALALHHDPLPTLAYPVAFLFVCLLAFLAGILASVNPTQCYLRAKALHTARLSRRFRRPVKESLCLSFPWRQQRAHIIAPTGLRPQNTHPTAQDDPDAPMPKDGTLDVSLPSAVPHEQPSEPSVHLNVPQYPFERPHTHDTTYPEQTSTILCQQCGTLVHFRYVTLPVSVLCPRCKQKQHITDPNNPTHASGFLKPSPFHKYSHLRAHYTHPFTS